MQSDRLNSALALAADLHRDQCRKGTDIPYLGHLLIVAGTVIDHGGDEDTAIAALLHDAVEDQGGTPTLRLIAERYGDRVASIVSEVTETAVQPKPPWKERKLAYLDHVSRMSREALLIASADKLHNARATLADFRRNPDTVWARFNGDADSQRWFYGAFLETARAHFAAPTDLLDELAFVDGALFGPVPHPVA